MNKRLHLKYIAKCETPGPTIRRPKPFFTYAALVLAGAAIAHSVGSYLLPHGQQSSGVFVPNDSKAASVPSSLAELLAEKPHDLANIDIGLTNLLCAQGLPGGENIDVSQCLATLDEWAGRIQLATQHQRYRAHDPRYAEHYHHSENYLRAELLLQTLQETCHAHYNPTLVDLKTGLSKDWAFTDAKDVFIHGLLQEPHAGSCSSMPVLYIAVGRRLGYPLKLVLAGEHVFCRWESPDGKDRFNIEGAGSGFSSFPDDYYKTWPHPLTDSQIKHYHLLQSLTPAEELASFLEARGGCWEDTHHLADAQVAYAYAHKFAPDWLQPQQMLSQVLAHEADRMHIAQYLPEQQTSSAANAIGTMVDVDAINRANQQRMFTQSKKTQLPSPNRQFSSGLSSTKIVLC